MSRIPFLTRWYVLDVAVALLALVGILDLVVRNDAPDTSLWLVVPLVIALVLSVVARRRLPFLGPVAYWVLAGGFSFIDWRLIPFMTSLFPVGMAVAFLIGNLRDALKASLGLAVVVGSATIIVYEIPANPTAELIFVPMEFAISWLAGFALRERAEQAQAAEERAARAERGREAAARVAVAEERARIARELHDIVAHAVSVMVLQIGAVRHKLPDALAEDRDVLNGVERTGRTALAEMRRLLGAMRSDGEGAELAPHPGLDNLTSLLEDVDRAGLPVQLHVEGEASPLPRAIDLSAYRIVQEGLTNSLKHARASRADVTLRYRDDGLQLEVRDDGIGAARDDGLGHGLVGIRERVKIYGGEMKAGSTPEGGFLLSAHLPLEGYAP